LTEESGAGARTPAEWGQQYALRRASYVALTDYLHDLSGKLLTQAGLDISHVEKRTKTVRSFVGKLERKGEKYDDPLTGVTDFAGLRIITYYDDDVARAAEVVKSMLDVDHERSIDKGQALDPDRFGYDSVQFIVRLGDDRKHLPECKEFADLVAEIQIRTVLQHAWAAISHKLAYKSPREAPAVLQRRLYRLSALLELADEQFISLRDETGKLAQSYSERLEGGQLDLPVDPSSLQAYFDGTGARDRWFERAISLGWGEHDWSEERIDRDRSDLLRVLGAAGIETIEQLDELLRDADRWGSELLAGIVGRARERRGGISLGADDVLALLVLAARVDEPSDLGEEIWADDLWETFSEAIHDVRDRGLAPDREPS
jgi:ppGpp synthetase/RelA/SpoT-type nucleotidyltranferase